MSAMDNESTATLGTTHVDRRSDREVVATRRFAAPAATMYRAWTDQDLFRQWWVPKSFGLSLLLCELDVREGGGYRLEFGHPSSDQPMAFYGKYIEVVPDACLVWTNEESSEGPVTTVTFAQVEGGTIVTVTELYPTMEALESEIASGAMAGMPETLQQLDDLVAGLAG